MSVVLTRQADNACGEFLSQMGIYSIPFIGETIDQNEPWSTDPIQDGMEVVAKCIYSIPPGYIRPPRDVVQHNIHQKLGTVGYRTLKRCLFE